MQLPLQQFRTQATFNRVFEKELREGSVKGISWTVDYNSSGFDREDLIKALIVEMWRIVIYTVKGDLIPQYGDILPKNGIEGLNSISEEYWRAVKELVTQYPRPAG
jgi:hypothetical protein